MTDKELADYCKEASKIISELDYENRMLQKENEQLKEQVNKGLYNTCLPYTTGYNKAIKDKETQQKEFIKYLEDENKKFDIKANGMGASSERDELIIKARAYREVLQKYKEIIGDNK